MKGKIHGDAVTFFADGKKHIVTPHKNGMREGIETEWYPSGQMRRQLGFTKDQPVGKPKRWHDNGLPVGRIVWVKFPGGTYTMGAKDERIVRGKHTRRVHRTPL